MFYRLVNQFTVNFAAYCTIYMCLSSQHGEREITTFMNCDNAFLSKTAPRQILWRSICCT